MWLHPCVEPTSYQRSRWNLSHQVILAPNFNLITLKVLFCVCVNRLFLHSATATGNAVQYMQSCLHAIARSHVKSFRIFVLLIWGSLGPHDVVLACYVCNFNDQSKIYAGRYGRFVRNNSSGSDISFWRNLRNNNPAMERKFSSQSQWFLVHAAASTKFQQWSRR